MHFTGPRAPGVRLAGPGPAGGKFGVCSKCVSVTIHKYNSLFSYPFKIITVSLHKYTDFFPYSFKISCY